MSEAGRPNCAWLNKLNISALKSSPILSQGSANRLMTEKSVLTKFGPEIGARDASPSSPAGGASKAQGLNQYPFPVSLVGTCEAGRPLHVAFAPAPTWKGLATSLGLPAGAAVPILI